MHIDQLKYFVDLAKTNSISATAKRLYVSQQAISESMKRLEGELNCNLIIRSRTGIQFTDDGKMLLSYAQSILDEYNSMQQYLQHKYNNGHQSGHLTIGVGPLATATILPKLLPHMHRLYPEISLIANENSSDNIITQVIDEELDFGLFGVFETEDMTPINQVWSNPRSNHHTYQNLQELLHFETLYIDRTVCVMASSHPLSLKHSLTLSELNAVKKTIHGYSITDSVASSCIHFSAQAEIHQQFMKENSTVCYMPYQTYLSHYAAKGFISVPIADAPDITNYLICRKQIIKELEPLYRTFIDTVLSLMPE